MSEGEKYTVRDVKLGGQLLLPEAELMSLVTLKPGEPFSREKLTESTKKIAERLGDEGYAFANANAVPDVDKENRTVAFAIMVDPGRRVYVRRINVVGNTRTRDEVVRREMRQLEGSFYDAQKLQLSKRRIDRLNYFAEVDVDTEPVPGTTDQVDVTVKVKEKPTGNILFGIGFSSADGFVLQGSVNQTNVFGSGKSIGLSANTSKVNRNIGLSYTDPYFTVDGVSAGFDIYDRKFDANALNIGNYVTETLGAGVRLGLPISELDRVNFGLTYEQTKITVYDNSPQRFIDFVNTYGSDPAYVPLTVAWSRDRRDSAIWTTTGTAQRALVEATLPVLDLRYYKLGYQIQWYWTPIRDMTLVLGGELGYGGGYDNQPLPFFKAYYTGGPTSVRGYQQSSLGPRDVNGVLGGSRKAVGNAEILFPFPGMGQDRSVRWGVFFDAGQVWNDTTGQTLSDLKMRYSTGGVLSWNSPFGPLKLIIAEPLNSQPGDQVQKFQFVFGQTF
jgi:outer membrane protein insertion porin family